MGHGDRPCTGRHAGAVDARAADPRLNIQLASVESEPRLQAKRDVDFTSPEPARMDFPLPIAGRGNPLQPAGSVVKDSRDGRIVHVGAVVPVEAVSMTSGRVSPAIAFTSESTTHWPIRTGFWVMEPRSVPAMMAYFWPWPEFKADGDDLGPGSAIAIDRRSRLLRSSRRCRQSRDGPAASHARCRPLQRVVDILDVD